jgi:hypothetical protein
MPSHVWKNRKLKSHFQISLCDKTILNGFDGAIIAILCVKDGLIFAQCSFFPMQWA